MQKPYPITNLEGQENIRLLDNSLTILFREAQSKEFVYTEYTGAGVWPAAADIGEKQLVLVKNVTDNAVRLYTRIGGTLKYIAFT